MNNFLIVKLYNFNLKNHNLLFLILILINFYLNKIICHFQLNFILIIIFIYNYYFILQLVFL